jgi:hypothetical protein
MSEQAQDNTSLTPDSSKLQFISEENGIFTYRDVESGADITSQSLIAGAKDNPSVTGNDAVKLGSTVKDAVNADNQGFYGSQPDIQSRKYNVGKTVSGAGNTNNKIEDDGTTVDAGQAVRSKFNRWSLFKTENIAGKSGAGTTSNKKEMSEALYGGPDGPIQNPTARNIVNFAKGTKVAGQSPSTSLGYDYDLADFIQCEHYGAISNNYLLTLRRFPYPVQDDIISPKIFDNTGKAVDAHQPDLARAITWLSPALGNDLKDILKFKVGYEWKNVESQLQNITKSKGNRGAAGSSIDGSPLLSAIEAGLNGRSAEESQLIRDRGAGFDPTSETYPNKVFGPYNVIKSVLAREQGLKFEQDFTLTFHYDIRGYGNTSPKAAFMDTMANLLALTYSNAPFWGGATRYLTSGSVGKPFGDYNKLRSGDYSGFLGSLKDQFMGAATGGWEDLKKGFGNSKILDNIVGGGLMKLFNGPQGATLAAAFLSGDPTGNWHLTVGNPMAPMMVIGNLAMQDAQFEFEGPLGYEDFPSKLKVTITLKPGRPRDKGDIESMFNAGRGRMYLQPQQGSAPDEGLVDAYGKKIMSDVLQRRASDMNHG